MKLRFNLTKSTQATAYLLMKRGGRENYTKIIKLLYLADRKAIDQIDLSITGDTYFSMPKGPVTSHILDLIHEEPLPNKASYWHEFISPPSDYSITLRENPGYLELSKDEINILDQILEEFGSADVWTLVDYTHRLPEYKKTESSILITIDEILTGLKKTDGEKELINKKFEFAADISALFDPD